VNILGVRAGSRLQTVLTALKVAAVLGIVALLFAFGHPVPAAGGGTVTVRGFVLAVSAGVFAFGGWHMVAYAAEETVEPERTIPRALLAGVLLVTACYIGLNAAYFRVLPVPAVAASHSIAADAVREVAGAAGARIVAVIVVLSALGANNGIILAGPRVYYAMARDGVLFRWMGDVHPRFRTPHLAIALQALWACVLVLTGSYESLFTQVVYTEWIFFALMVCALFPLRRRSGYAPRYRAPGYPVLPLIFVAAALAMALSRILASSRAGLPAIILVLSGLPVYYFWARRPARGGPSMDRSDP
jgi:APA family basic amino acid/polyamine antiporter